MNQKIRITNALLWAAAILASAILGAPTFLSLILLPMLGITALLFVRPAEHAPEHAQK